MKNPKSKSKEVKKEQKENEITEDRTEKRIYNQRSFGFTVTPDKLEVPKTGCLEITINPEMLGREVNIVVVTLDSVLFVMEGAQGHKGSESQIYYMTSSLEEPKIIRVKMRDLENLDKIISEGSRQTPEGKLIVFHFTKTESNFWISQNTRMLRFVQNIESAWGEKVCPLYLKEMTTELKELKKGIMEKWAKMKKKKKKPKEQVDLDVEDWEYEEEYNRKCLELNGYSEKIKKIKEERQKKEEKRKADLEKDRILNAQLKTAREDHRLESETDTSKIVNLVTTASQRQRILNKKPEPKPRIGPRSEMGKGKKNWNPCCRKNPCCIIL